VDRGPRLHLFSSGTIAFGGVEAPVPFFLCSHPQGNVLIDGGNPLAVAVDGRAHWGPLADYFSAVMTEEQHCVAQLAAVGVAPESVCFVVQTHLHIDHTGALGHFPGASTLVHADELRAARTVEQPHAHGYVRADFEQPGIAWQTLDGDRDLFGDGTIRLLETPGHSAGHMSILLTPQRTGPVLLTGDAVDTASQWERRRPLRALDSQPDAERSLGRLRDLAGELDPLVVFGHDAAGWAKLSHAPERHYD
jgi:N-acyl homoserine lactone hydrolase